LEVVSPYDGAVVGTTYLASGEQVEQATQACVDAAPVMAALPLHERLRLLRALADGIRANREELAQALVGEAGKPIRDALTEVDRAAFTVDTGVAVAAQLHGEIIPLDMISAAAGHTGYLRRFPIGPVAAITPFNFPLNLSLHKIVPAIVAGNPVVLKPASKTPLAFLMAVKYLDEAGLPKGALSVLPMRSELANAALVEDDRFKLITFTGSAEVGWGIKDRATRKRVTLELGGNAGLIVDHDADLDYAVERITAGGFSFAGQSCVSVQRTYVHTDVYDALAGKLVARVEKLRLGDPRSPETDLGPMIEPRVARRTESWVAEAVESGARVLTGGEIEGPLNSIMQPTVLDSIPPDAAVCRKEVFAPLVGLYPYERFEDALEAVNDSDYGLQAGVFTETLEHAFLAYDVLDVGGVIINDVPTFRTDPMPYGGVKASGLGREGIRYAVEEQTEPKLLVLNRVHHQAKN
jgi:glyceraldehyde-3-phosphate dehydrogenase (NADP+)